jgi:hypothetical protein
VVDATDIDGTEFRDAGVFHLTGWSGSGTNAHGRLFMVFGGEFGAYWGAVPGETRALHGAIPRGVANISVPVLRGAGVRDAGRLGQAARQQLSVRTAEGAVP